MRQPHNYTIFSLLALSLGHIVHDCYLPFLPAMMPLIVEKTGITLAETGLREGDAGLLIGAYNLSKGLPQPVSGFITDRTGWLGCTALAVPITALALSSIGRWSNPAAIGAAAVIGGVCSSVFHPQGAKLASIVGEGRRGLAMGTFATCGSIGIALGPVYVLSLVGRFGLERSYLAAVPALLLFPFLLRYAPLNARVEGRETAAGLAHALREKRGFLALLFIVAAFRSGIAASFSSFLGVYLVESRGVAVESTKWPLFVFLGAEGLGYLLGGHLSDRLGRSTVIRAGLLSSIGPLLLATHARGSMFPLILALGSVLLSVPLPALTVMAQEAVSEGMATVAGLVWAGEAAGSILVFLVGAVADRMGIGAALSFAALCPAVGFAVALAIPSAFTRTASGYTD
ncbi:MAG: MFS transporter [Firmicutes bacterium]|nr:MFS transporter [Bacillota bacterium]